MGTIFVLLVAICLSAPALSVKNGTTLYKCCPKGQTFKDATLTQCVQNVSSWSYIWPAKKDKNGKLYFGVTDDAYVKSETFNASQHLAYKSGKVSSLLTFLKTSDMPCETHSLHLDQSAYLSFTGMEPV